MRVLSLLKRIRRAAIGGAAGSGKTFLAIEKAKRLAAEGFNTLLTCYTEPLAELLSTLSDDVPNLTVLTIDQLGKELAGSSGDPNALFDAMGQREERPFDAIVVDEGQDFTLDWWIALESCLREGKDSVIYVFHDTHQTLNRGGGTLPDSMTEYTLEDNVRNTQAICNVVRGHYLGDVPITARGPAGRKLEKVPYEQEQDLPQLLGKVINRLLTTERFKNGDLIVLTPKRLDQSSLTRMKLPGASELVIGRPAAKSRQIQYASIEQFKGLERQVAVVVELDDELPDDESLRHALCYVAFSRPRHHLVVMGHPNVLSDVSRGGM